jgi:uncharacterized protein YbjT (DUF2867 family)
MTSPILVTGGTGTLGRLVVRRLRGACYDVRVLSRRGGESRDGVQFLTGDLATGEGIEAAADGVAAIVHCAGNAKGDAGLTRNLVRAASSQTRLPHLVYISVVGADRVPIGSRVDRAMFGYFESKLETERVVAGSGLPWTTLRATQFHELILMVARQPTNRRRRGGGPARRPHARRAGRPGARHRWAAGVRRGRPVPRLPSGHSAAPADHADMAAGQGSPRVPGRRQPGSRAGRGTPDLGGVPCRPG